MISRLPFLIPLIAITEIYLIIKVGGAIGFLPTVAIVLTTGMTGVVLLRQQGFQLLGQLNQKMSAGQMPAAELVEGVALMMGGVMLITPGFLTDVIGFSLLLPWTRKRMVSKLARVLESQVQSGATTGFYYSSNGYDSRRGTGAHTQSGFQTPPEAGAKHSQNVFDGEYEQVNDPVAEIEEKK